MAEDEFMDRLRFLVQLLEREFVVSWDIEQVRKQSQGVWDPKRQQCDGVC